MMTSFIFDLDGTISDPLDGIARSLNYALESFGYSARSIDELSTYIGPPLDQAFSSLTGKDDPLSVNALVAKYRERYASVGFSENTLYPGIAKILTELVDQGISLGICTSKPVQFAEKILIHFKLRELFDYISGGDVGVQKWQQLASLKEEGVITEKSIMIGDRHVDLDAAHRNHLKCAGVLWGYGSYNELKQQKPDVLLSHVDELLTLSSVLK
ncbi:MAG: 5'-nucleotidase [Candidatus Celerinatantimonas neptuna]|nr:MAG: 5'-nucleotidase [Candidatus Celerinatantimonas neptuna]